MCKQKGKKLKGWEAGGTSRHTKTWLPRLPWVKYGYAFSFLLVITQAALFAVKYRLGNTVPLEGPRGSAQLCYISHWAWGVRGGASEKPTTEVNQIFGRTVVTRQKFMLGSPGLQAVASYGMSCMMTLLITICFTKLLKCNKIPRKRK